MTNSLRMIENNFTVIYYDGWFIMTPYCIILRYGVLEPAKLLVCVPNQ